MSSLLGHGFRYALEIKQPDGEIFTFEEHNLLPQVAVNHVAGLIRGDGTTPISTWYVGLFEGNYVPTPGVTAADLPGVVTESTAYSEVTRPAWTNAYDGVSVIDNAVAKAVFTMTAAKTIYGAFLISNSVKGGNTGLILSIARFSSPRVLEAGTQFGVIAGLTLIPTTL